VSPTSVDEDTIVKPKAYARAGIPEYWRVERTSGRYVVVMHRLQDDQYVQTGAVPLDELLAEG
jgi:Uma2 family endonuclease